MCVCVVGFFFPNRRVQETDGTFFASGDSWPSGIFPKCDRFRLTHLNDILFKELDRQPSEGGLINRSEFS